MLKSWAVERFKPITDSGNLPLAPVTVLAGINSSGKSSLIQSIMMVAQTLTSPVLDRPLLPNGALVQLGTFNDILNHSATSRSIAIAFDLEMSGKPIQRAVRRRSLGLRSVRVYVKLTAPPQTGGVPSAIEASQVIVDKVALEIRCSPPERVLSDTGQLILDAEDGEFTLDFSAERASQQEIEHFLERVSADYRRLIPYSEDMPNYIGEFDGRHSVSGRERTEAGPFLVSLQHFLPNRLIGRYNVFQRRQQRLSDAVLYYFQYDSAIYARTFISQSAEVLDPDMRLPAELQASIDALCAERGVDISSHPSNLRDLASWYHSLKAKSRRAIWSRLRKMLLSSLDSGAVPDGSESERLAEGLETVTNYVYSDTLDQAVQSVVSFFASRIRYLGPLRADPQAAQRFAPSSELDDVGAKGEYAAAVYDANQRATIRWTNPISQTVEHGYLRDALDKWSQYLGVAEHIGIATAGQSGVSWQIIHANDRVPLPLTAVGVGVSQVLPILVMGLLAPQDSLLIVEQPELHLHPRVQSKLGDFFLGLAKCGKQCLIETHSENLVSQLRYHIVSSRGAASSDCSIYFVSQSATSATTFERIEVTSLGTIANWPSGFFDESMIQEDRITRESIKIRSELGGRG